LNLGLQTIAATMLELRPPPIENSNQSTTKLRRYNRAGKRSIARRILDEDPERLLAEVASAGRGQTRARARPVVVAHATNLHDQAVWLERFGLGTDVDYELKLFAHRGITDLEPRIERPFGFGENGHSMPIVQRVAEQRYPD
jgi:hypothetical protein